MKSREDIHKKLNDLFTLNLIEKLQEPLLKKINCLNKGNFNNRFDVRVASKDVDLNSWWKHPIYVIAKPSSKNVVIGITIQPQRWPRNNEDYSNEFSECIDRNNAKINDLIKAHAINATLVKKEVKTDGKFVLSNSFNVIIDNANPSDEDYTRFIDFFASLCSIVVSLSDELPVKWNSSSEGLNNENQELPEAEVKNDEDDDIGFAAMNIVKGDAISTEVFNKYYTKWQKVSYTYNLRMGIDCLMTNDMELFVDDSVFPVLSKEQLLFIENQITDNKVIPILNFLPSGLNDYCKHIWFVIPFCIWGEEFATTIFIDKNGFYSVTESADDYRMIFNWENIESIELDSSFDGDPYISRLYLHTDNGYLTIDEFNVNNNYDKGSYLSIIQAIYNVRKSTLIASKGKDFWIEGSGGEGFILFNSYEELLEAENWKSASRPDPMEYGDQLVEISSISDGTDKNDEYNAAKEAVMNDILTSLAFLYVYAARIDGSISEVEGGIIYDLLDEWSGGDVPISSISKACDYKSLIKLEDEMTIIGEVATNIKNNLPAENISAVKSDLIKIANVDENLLDEEKGIILFISSFLD
jgi:hypothetical protein